MCLEGERGQGNWGGQGPGDRGKGWGATECCEKVGMGGLGVCKGLR